MNENQKKKAVEQPLERQRDVPHDAAPGAASANQEEAAGTNGPSGGRRGRKKRTPEQEAAKIEAEKTELLQKLNAEVADDVKTRVAMILNHFPHARNDDLELSIKYWQLFDDESLSEADAVSFRTLRRLTRETTIVRARAKIQNDYKLFQADKEVRQRRMQLADQRREEEVDDQPDSPTVHVFCDESGKTSKEHQSYVVGSVWINQELQLVKISQALAAARRSAGISGELHFAEMSKRDVDGAVAYLRAALSMSAMMSMKAVVIRRSDAGGRPPDDVIFRLHEQLLIQGIEHELATNRFALPRYFSVMKDRDDGSDRLQLTDLRQRLQTGLPTRFGKGVRLHALEAEDSKLNTFLQLADLFTGAVTRILNRASDAQRNHKDEFADQALTLVGLDLSGVGPLPLFQDFAKLIRIT